MHDVGNNTSMATIIIVIVLCSQVIKSWSTWGVIQRRIPPFIVAWYLVSGGNSQNYGSILQIQSNCYWVVFDISSMLKLKIWGKRSWKGTLLERWGGVSRQISSRIGYRVLKLNSLWKPLYYSTDKCIALLFPAGNISHTNKNHVNEWHCARQVDILENIVKFSSFYLLGLA